MNIKIIKIVEENLSTEKVKIKGLHKMANL